MTNQRLRTLAVGTWLLPDFSHEAEKLVMTEGQEMGEFKAHAGIIPAWANQTPH